MRTENGAGETLAGKWVVIKYGGAAMSGDYTDAMFAGDLLALADAGAHPVVVHGGGAEMTRVAAMMGIDSIKPTEISMFTRMVPLASGCLAIPSIALAVTFPSPTPAPMAARPIARPAPIAEAATIMACSTVNPPFRFLGFW